MSKMVEQINISLDPELKRELLEVCAYEHTKVTELIRELIRQKVRAVLESRAYQAWKRREK